MIQIKVYFFSKESLFENLFSRLSISVHPGVKHETVLICLCPIRKV